MQERYNDAKKAGFGMSYTTSWGATGNTRTDASSHLKSELDDIKSKLEEKISFYLPSPRSMAMIFKVRRCRRSSITTRIRVAVVPVENQRRSARLAKRLRKS